MMDIYAPTMNKYLQIDCSAVTKSGFFFFSLVILRFLE
ncbi:hypothetical protein NC99_10400 [Sunxiuqinia dokdonensis]|uniref:Uncharacterized protein n=1 Tax=Sunxiuqinia dokdonensis TaxID=1409788 RepID=A0A0L8VCP2_9BACT|nr:hypothetical protein NC99_10400 [Sunxiuqinia dokdonensis]